MKCQNLNSPSPFIRSEVIGGDQTWLSFFGFILRYGIFCRELAFALLCLF